MRRLAALLLLVPSLAWGHAAVLPHFRDNNLSTPEVSPTDPSPINGVTNLATYAATNPTLPTLYEPQPRMAKLSPDGG